MPENRLIHETSPYLRQHAHNPVDWYPWGDEALRRAREEDRPIFLSIGYAACHWCHVMERESFEDPEIARLLNESFVSIKVDREERPDLDEVYMHAVQLLTGSGGWPMSVWLTPDLRPFHGGTYFPPEDRWGRPGFATILAEVARAYRERRRDVERAADELAQAITQLERPGTRRGPGLPDRGPIRRAVASLRRTFDAAHGGFGPAPKFPLPAGLALLLHEFRREPDAALLRMVTVTLDHMARGGIYDQVGGGFHRYSTDAPWLVPHFEKMLYDNALLVPVYLEAFKATGDAFYRRVAVETLEWAIREMRHPEGGFFSSLDADSEGEEGRFYLWTPDAVAAVLGEEDASLFNRVYGITPEGNFEGQSIPHLARPVPDWAAELGAQPDEFQAHLDALRIHLREARSRRVWPGKDDKILTAWNGLMVTALARAAQCLGETRWADEAAQTAGFLLEQLQRDSRLLRSFREGKAHVPGFLEDYAFLTNALLDLHAATGDSRWVDSAKKLADDMVDLYWDDGAGGFFLTARDQEIALLRTKSPYDGALPSGNSVAAEALLRLAELGEDGGREERARQSLQAFGNLISASPDAFHRMLVVLDRAVEVPPPAAAAAGSEVVRIEARLDGEPVHPGNTACLHVQVHVTPGWHVNAHEPPEPYLTPTVIEILPERDLDVLDVCYPEAQPAEDGAPAGYSDDIEVTAQLRAAPDAQPGAASLRVRLHYQPCTTGRCLAPAQAEVELPVHFATPDGG